MFEYEYQDHQETLIAEQCEHQGPNAQAEFEKAWNRAYQCGFAAGYSKGRTEAFIKGDDRVRDAIAEIANLPRIKFANGPVPF